MNQEDQPSLAETGHDLEPVFARTGTYPGPPSADIHKAPGASAENGDASSGPTNPSGPETRSEEHVDMLAQHSFPEESNALLGIEEGSIREISTIDGDVQTNSQTHGRRSIPVAEAAPLRDNNDADLSPVRTESEGFGVTTQPPTLTPTVDQPKEEPVSSLVINSEPAVQGDQEAARSAISKNASHTDYKRDELHGFSTDLSTFPPAADTDSNEDFDPMLMGMELIEQLSSFEGSWPESGWVDNRGAVTGCRGAVRAFQFAPFDQVHRLQRQALLSLAAIGRVSNAKECSLPSSI